MCKSTLEYLSTNLKRSLHTLSITYRDYLRETDSRRRTFAFRTAVRAYLDFDGYITNIKDIIDEYQENFDIVASRLDYNYLRSELTKGESEIQLHELTSGVLNLLLHGNIGRFTPGPLIRSAIEALVTRIVFNTQYSKKYYGKTVVTLNTFKLDDIFSAAVDLNIEFQLGIECFRRLYSWGSLSTHYSWRMERHELWHAFRFIQHVQRSGLIVCSKNELDGKIDAILDRLLIRSKIQIE